MKLYVHADADIIPVTVAEQEKVAYLRSLIAGLTNKQDVFLSAFPQGKVLSDTTVLGGLFDEKADVYVVRAEERKEVPIAPIQAPALASIQYVTLTKYSFYESDENWVKVIVPLPGVKSHPKNLIECEFGLKSFTIKVHELGGKHFIFGVPRLQCHIQPAESKYSLGTDKLILSLKKVKSSDNFHSLFKAKTIGGEDSD